jgi:hypothetical protein
MAVNVFNRVGTRPLTENNRQWDELIDKIVQGEVIPVIGPEFLAEDLEDPDKWMDPHQTLINMLADSKEIKGEHCSFSELLYDDAYPAREREDIYDMLGEVFEPEMAAINAGKLPQDPIFRPSKLLVKLLKVCKFRFVITTSFIPLVEYAMKGIYGENGVNVMIFSNNPLGNADLKGADDIQKPSVYYMFGRVCRQSKRYVVNDSDMLAFCRSWLSEAPSNLVNVLRNKYLLILGNNYSDWLCRFIWYSMKTELDTKPKGMIVNNDEGLQQFMKRIDAFTQRSPEAVIEKIETLVAEKMEAQEQLKYQKPDFNTDVFLSYSRRDADVVKKLYDELKAKGLRVWYDRENLGVGDKFMEEIKTAIRKTRVFIPVLSHNIENEKNESHPYRTEWETAMEVASSYGRNFILPICEKGFDFYSSNIPEKLQRHNANLYDPETYDFGGFVTDVYNYLMNL